MRDSQFLLVVNWLSDTKPCHDTKGSQKLDFLETKNTESKNMRDPDQFPELEQFCEIGAADDPQEERSDPWISPATQLKLNSIKALLIMDLVYGGYDLDDVFLMREAHRSEA